MKKVYIPFLVFLIFLTLYFAFFISNKNVENSFQAYERLGVGKDNALTKMYIIGRKGSQTSVLFATEMTRLLEEFTDGNKLRIETYFLNPGSSDFVTILESIKNIEHSMIIVSPDTSLVENSRQALLKSNIFTVLFSTDSTSVCNEETKNMSKHIWNFGLPVKSYLESYLSFLHQMFAKVGKDLSCMIVNNEHPRIDTHVDYTKSTVQELGFKYIGKISLDDRISDTYQTTKQIFDFHPDILLFYSTPKGCPSFLSAISKLNLTFDIAVSFIEGCSDTDFASQFKESRGIMYPTQFVPSSKNKNNESLTHYQAQLISSFIHKIFFRGYETLPVSSAFTKLDGTQIQTKAGLVMLDSSTHSLIQPLHVAKVDEKGTIHVQYLGDVSLSKTDICTQ